MPSAVYTNAKYLMLTDQLQWAQPATTFRAMLVAPSYTYNSAHLVVADVIAHEVADLTYGRVSVTSRTVESVIAADRVRARAANVSFVGLDNVTVSGCIIYRRTGTDDLTPSDDALVCFLDFATTIADGNDLIMEFADSVVFVVRTSPMTIEVLDDDVSQGDVRAINFADGGTGSFEVTVIDGVANVDVNAAGGAGGSRVFQAGFLGAQDGVNTVFTALIFVHGGATTECVYFNGVLIRSGAGFDYLASESGGVGTGYDTVTLQFAPTADDTLRLDYVPG